MRTNDARPAISDLPLDLFGDPDTLEPVPGPPREPDIYCWKCQTLLTDGLSTCFRCGAQNELIPVVTSTPPQLDSHPEQETSNYLGRLAFTFTYIGGDIARGAIKAGERLVDHVVEWTVSGSGRKNRQR